MTLAAAEDADAKSSTAVFRVSDNGTTGVGAKDFTAQEIDNDAGNSTGGTVSTSTSWTDTTKDYVLTSQVVIPAGKTLTIDLGRMVLNPDVTVRERGVVEKCTFCVQRIQEKKLLAKLENRPLGDNEIQTACMQVCPAGAIIFGDRNNTQAKLTDLFADQRNYNLLEEIHTLPTVGYLTKVRNTDVEEKKA